MHRSAISLLILYSHSVPVNHTCQCQLLVGSGRKETMLLLDAAVFAGSFVVAYVVWKFVRDTRKRRTRQPPSLWSLPLIGSILFLPRVRIWPKEFIKMSARMGNVFAFYLGSQYVSCILLASCLFFVPSLFAPGPNNGQFAPWNFPSVAFSLLLPGPFAPRLFRSQERRFRLCYLTPATPASYIKGTVTDNFNVEKLPCKSVQN